jgi:hypothetical protein
MFARKKPEKTRLDQAIDTLLGRIVENDYEPEETAKMVGQLEKLHKLKELETPWRPSPDTVLTVAGSVLGIVLILGYERANVVTSKALAFVLKLR